LIHTLSQTLSWWRTGIDNACDKARDKDYILCEIRKAEKSRSDPETFRGALRLLEAPAEGPEDARRRVDRECMMVHLAVALLSVDQHDEAVELLRTVSLSDGQETMFRRSINHRLYGFPSKKAATTLLHALHLARDPDWKDLPAEERVRRAMICQEAGEMMRGLCHPQMTYFFDAAKRLHPGK
jgi:hypothetical protein